MDRNIFEDAFKPITLSNDEAELIAFWTNRRFKENGAGEDVVEDRNDYVEGGELYCGNCRTRKTIHIAPLGANPKTSTKKVIVRCKCKCEDDAERKYNEMQKKITDAERIKFYRDDGIPDGRLREYTFQNDTSDKHLYETIAKPYIDYFDEMYKMGCGYVFYGPCGTGKTFLAVAIANALIDKMHPCYVTNFAKLSNKLQETYDGKQAFIDGLNKYDLLVIDDFGIERNSEYMNEVVFQIIDARYVAKKPMIITTNLSKDELNHPNENSKRIISRLIQMCSPVEFTGADKRVFIDSRMTK